MHMGSLIWLRKRWGCIPENMVFELKWKRSKRSWLWHGVEGWLLSRKEKEDIKTLRWLETTDLENVLCRVVCRLNSPDECKYICLRVEKSPNVPDLASSSEAMRQPLGRPELKSYSCFPSRQQLLMPTSLHFKPDATAPSHTEDFQGLACNTTLSSECMCIKHRSRRLNLSLFFNVKPFFSHTFSPFSLQDALVMFLPDILSPGPMGLPLNVHIQPCHFPA